ncbi:MAG: NAD(P)/FAD-dependent oxidoreductase [Myxococcales bacterium]|nr:NAD(P)/FAD-dependent oxidoreductase [Myxococcales bacterium]
MAEVAVVGAGPNGLAAAVALARAGKRVRLLERAPTAGGACRSAELTLPGFVHDVCAAIHPLAAASPFLGELPLVAHGLQWVNPPAPLAHPFDDGSAAVLERSIRDTGETLGEDARRYAATVGPLAEAFAELAADLLSGVFRMPRHPLAFGRFGSLAWKPARRVAEARFEGKRARALFAGVAAHGLAPLEEPFTSAFGLLLCAAGHAVGWPFPRGGSQRLVDALASVLESLGGEIVPGHEVASVDELPWAQAVLFDVTPAQLLRLAGHRFSSRYRAMLARYRYGPGVFKVDFALSGPIPWRAAQCARAGTVHLGGTLEEVAASGRAVAQGRPPERPFVVLAQHSLFDATRAPRGRHTAWAYCHVPHGSPVEMTDRIEAQIERFAPGFRELVLGRRSAGPARLEAYNPNLVGGDISGGSLLGLQLFLRPGLRPRPHATPDPRIFLCSSSTPPGPGVHGMCGYLAARTVLGTALRARRASAVPRGLRRLGLGARGTGV